MLLQLQLLRLHLFVWVLVFSLTPLVIHAQSEGKFDQADKFRQLEELLPTPNGFRTGSGAPGPQYWQQQVNYDIDVRLDDENQKLFGKEVITYRNNSRDTLRYLWLQLDANIRRPNSEAQLAATSSGIDRMSFKQLQGMMVRRVFDGGIDITRCVDSSTNQPLEYTIVKTMMRVDLPNP